MGNIPIKNEQEIKALRESGKILAETLELVCSKAKPGIATIELDQIAEKNISKYGARPGFKGFHGYPFTICSAVDEIIVHGFPNKNQILKEGDLFTVDCGVVKDGMNTDAARSIGIGKINQQKQNLINTAKFALEQGIAQAMPGNHVGDISKVIGEIIKDNGFYVIHELTGHGLGKTLHEEPIIPNYWDGKGPQLKAGMVLAIEPIFSAGTHKMKTLEDGWTIVTADNSCSVQQENTILITPDGPVIITQEKS